MKTKYFFTIITISTLLFACTKINPNLVTITGKITNPIGESVFFESEDTTYSTTTNDNGTFVINFSMDSSKYISFNHGVEQTAMYINPGDNINLIIDTKQFDETIKYQGSPASSFLAKIFLWWQTTNFYGEEYYLGSSKDYETFLDKHKLSLIEELEAVNDSSFIKNEKNDIERSIARYVSRKEKFEEWSSDYGKDVRAFLMQRKELDKRYDFKTAIDSLNSSEYTVILNEYRDTLNYLLSKVSNKDYIKEVKKNAENRKKWWLERKSNTDNVPKEGELAIDFTYPDKGGTEFSLSTFKGELVYIDVWATWCGPCISEIPALHKLEQEYHDKNVSFISISIDKDKDTWLKMVNDKELGGIQLWAGNLWEGEGLNGIAKNYAIYSIPRFMLFSTDGIVISTDAPRPSSAGIRSLLDSNL